MYVRNDTGGGWQNQDQRTYMKVCPYARMVGGWLVPALSTNHYLFILSFFYEICRLGRLRYAIGNEVDAPTY